MLSYTEWLFFHIWKKSPIDEKSCTGIMIPDTVIYRWAQPYFWYFTNNKHRVMRKKKDRIQLKQIEEVFKLGISKSNIVAEYSNYPSNDDKK